MISICIPIYNFNVSSLVKALESQMQLIEQKAQLVLIDDASKEEIRVLNQPVCSNHKYIKLDQNIGRSAIRNLFLNHANHQHLLFLDCDSLVEQPKFIANYIAAIIEDNKSVICGGRVYPGSPPDKEYMLRWKYGVYKESKSAKERSKHPNRSFMTNNFVVPKTVLNAIGFDERLRDYGHEDTLFGCELSANNITIRHIDNPVLNGHLENNQDYIANTQKAIENLVHILNFTQHKAQIVEDVTLLSAHKKLKAVRFLISIGFALFGNSIKSRLTQGKVSLNAFNFYKLGYLTSVWKK